MAFLRMSGLILAALLGLSLPIGQASHAHQRAGCYCQTSPPAVEDVSVRTLSLPVLRLGLAPLLCMGLVGPMHIWAVVDGSTPMPDPVGAAVGHSMRMRAEDRILGWCTPLLRCGGYDRRRL